MTSHPAFPPLPIDAVLQDVLAALAKGMGAVLVAEPGAGKTTRVPLALLQADWRKDSKIVMLVPRRVAARAAAAQMARLLGEAVGQTVGYRVRLDSKLSTSTRIEIVTEGVFTRMISDDPFLSGIAAVVFDEFHERSLDADLALALSLDVQKDARPDLKLLVMSATIDAARVAEMIGNVPQIAAQGRTFPVETFYCPMKSDERMEVAIANTVLRALQDHTGSILVFLPGAGEITRTAEYLQGRIPPDVFLTPLYGALDTKQQDSAISPAPAGQRKVVLASAIAETSLTIEGVRVVIDCGFSRVPRYDPGSGLTRLETVRVSQASAAQRRGRAGRLEPGICYRLWLDAQTRSFPAYNRPEILEADLAPFVLSCAAFGVTAPENLKFLDQPPATALAEARTLLQKLNALDDAGRLTANGKDMNGRPLPPRLAHMLQKAEAQSAGKSAAEFALLLTERGLGGTSSDLDERHAKFMNDNSPRVKAGLAQAHSWVKAPTTVRVSAGDALAFAYPDRIALQRKDRPGEFLLASGKGAFVDKSDPLAKQMCIVVAELQGSEARPRIVLAAGYDQSKIEVDFADKIVTEDVFIFDVVSKRVRARRVTRFEALILREQTRRAEGEQVQHTLLTGIRQIGLSVLLAEKDMLPFLARLAFLYNQDPERWPQTDIDMLEQSLEEWLAPFIPQASGFDDITPHDLRIALEARLAPDKMKALSRDAPSHFTAPTGQSFPIDYSRSGGPAVAVRVQQLYGVAVHPTLAGGKVPLTFDLLSPAHRPIQTTQDLPAFWRGSWADVRRDMRGRYPRHEWPEDPANATPTTRVKPRN